jgi:hypothetical protein
LQLLVHYRGGRGTFSIQTLSQLGFVPQHEQNDKAEVHYHPWAMASKRTRSGYQPIPSQEITISLMRERIVNAMVKPLVMLGMSPPLP